MFVALPVQAQIQRTGEPGSPAANAIAQAGD
jgi:hypothetical protein